MPLKIMMSTLYLVATPIGHLDDVTHRALKVLSSVTYIACEHPHHSQKLLKHYGITTPCIRYHQHNEQEKLTTIVADLKAGKSIALISDAGCPNFSDPGLLLVQEVQKAGLSVVPIPGPNAANTALISSGLPPHPHYFYGFLPAKTKERQDVLQDLSHLSATLVFYEAPHRLKASLKDCLAILGNREACLARELTKQYETIWRTSLQTLFDHADDHARGEMVVLIRGNDLKYNVEDETILQYLTRLKPHMPTKTAIDLTAQLLNLKKNHVYKLDRDHQ
jgi:16S rRNA (cytidine1402-2'-O)-methyltransferase